MQYNKLEDSDTGNNVRHIQSQNINPGGSVSVDAAGLLPGIETPEAKRKKYIKWGIIGGIALIAVVLAIVLPLTLGGGGGNNGDNHGPLAPGQMNPYDSVQGSEVYSPSGSSFSGYLLANI